MIAIILTLGLVVAFIALIASLIDMLWRDDATNAVIISGVAMVLVMIASFLYIVIELVRWYV